MKYNLMPKQSSQVERYRLEKPEFVLEQFLNGQIDIHGMFQDRRGRVINRFYVSLNAKWADGVGTLAEDFTFTDGRKLYREWTINKTQEGHYSGVASDVVGEATGVCAGNTFFWKYKIRIPIGKREFFVSVEDWMYLMDSKTMINRVYFKKFGICWVNGLLTFNKK